MKVIFILLGLIIKIFALDLSFENFSSDFIQSIDNKKTKINYTGHFIITHNKALWNYQNPMHKDIFIDNNKITIIEYDLEQVIISKLERIPNLNEIFKNAKKINQNTYEAKYENTTYILNLKENQVENISYKDEFDNNVNIKLLNQKRNTHIDENLFIPKIPKNFDIVS
ncbi:periplasmic outer membrane-specific lipoprotein chaperone [Campylobacter novaezeelandiae]|uniref:Outer membrane lipoprotein chaperone LolA n=1 Tax=Campylobacter novaezeelandiae TaxID=2267891 RepID=A0A4Q9JUW0_9BACT|nr:LolA-like outer membrane lipoprotein chaperone [Campylobacter novaezeelandiae]QWU79955.1 periplasmic outer membrane-specific lipoprotein chaperone [Campylobacter novaezeelandiae]TBR78884.1 outer membrane lipoprotein chaperone LolA [Campylobacter novaezeelandiae]